MDSERQWTGSERRLDCVVRSPAAALSHGCSQRDIYASLLLLMMMMMLMKHWCVCVCVTTKAAFLLLEMCTFPLSHIKISSKASICSEGVTLGTHTELFYISFYLLAAVCDITCGKSDWRIKGRLKHTKPWLTARGKVTVFHWDAGIIMEFVI